MVQVIKERVDTVAGHSKQIAWEEEIRKERNLREVSWKVSGLSGESAEVVKSTLTSTLCSWSLRKNLPNGGLQWEKCLSNYIQEILENS